MCGLITIGLLVLGVILVIADMKNNTPRREV